MTDDARCTERVPQPLWGNLEGPPKRCKRKDEHRNHKAWYFISGVGTVRWEWKTPRIEHRPLPPGIVLPRPVRRDLIQVHTRCACPDWKIGLMHVAPCPLAGLTR
jgi:hypothetical protein